MSVPPWARWLCFLALVGAAVFWFLTRPDRLDAALLDGLEGDAAAGENVFLAAGCASCHTAPEDKSEGPPTLAGGRRFATQFGTFVAPNISPDQEHGVGSWSDEELLTAITQGVSPEGEHLYPIFPYGSYNKADQSDLVDLVAYLRTLPASSIPSQPHDLALPFTFRRGIGLWNLVFERDDWVLQGAPDPQIARGRMLVEALGHCGECHTPRNIAGGLKWDLWLSGAANPSGKGRIPAIDPGSLYWSTGDIVAYLETGLTPDYDSAGGDMVAVIDKISRLPATDREAIAAYLKAIPAVLD